MKVVHAMPDTSPLHVQSFARGLNVIRAFTGFPLTLSEVAQRSGMPPAAARRYLATLTDLEYLEQEGALFRAKSKLLELAQPYLKANETARKAGPILRLLSDEVSETATLTQYDNGEVINVLATQTAHELSIQVGIGRHLPAYCTAMGRAMLSLLPEQEARHVVEASALLDLTGKTLTGVEAIMEQIGLAREQGYCLVEEEHTLGIRTLSIALQLPQGALIALSVPTPTARENRQAYLQRALKPLQLAAQRMGDD